MGSAASAMSSAASKLGGDRSGGTSRTAEQIEEEADALMKGDVDEDTTVQVIDLTGIENTGYIADHYVFSDNLLGRSTQTLVRLSTHKGTKRNRAIKQHNLKAEGVSVQKVKQQVVLLRDVRAHPNVIKLYETFVDKTNLFEILEYCSGGRIFDLIMAEECCTEQETACVVQQVMKATEYMHSRLICHRDIKPEHVMIKEKGTLFTSQVKVIDFKTAVEFSTPGQIFTERVGTPFYCSPQVHQGRYTELCDVWAIGVLMHLMLVGYPLDQRSRLINAGIKKSQDMSGHLKGRLLFSQMDWSGFSVTCSDLLGKLLADRETDRPAPRLAASFDWLAQQAPQPVGSRTQISGDECVGLDHVRTTNFKHQLDRIQQKKVNPYNEPVEKLAGPKISSSMF